MLLRTADLTVLVCDEDISRAVTLAKLIRLGGCDAIVAPDLLTAGRLAAGADVIIVDDDAFGDAGLALLRRCAREQPALYRCVASRWSRFADVRGAASYVLVKPFAASALADALAAATTKRALPRTATPPAHAPMTLRV